MAITIPIVTEFVGTGIEKAKKEFAQLEGIGAKAQFAIKKAAVPAAAALAGLGTALFDATKGAMEDAAAQELLAKALQNNTAVTDAQIKANEDWISSQGKLLGVTDDQLRPVIAKLATQTGSLTKAQEGAALAMDIAAATGKPLSAVSDALAKAYGGNTKALAKLDPKLKDLIKGGLDAEGAMSVLADTFGGAASTKANTAEGQFQRLGVTLAETKESIGAALLPAINAILPILTKFGNWASENTPLFLTIAGAIAGVAASVLIVNGAIAAWTAITTAATAVQAAFNAVLALNPIVLIGVAVVALIAGLVIAYKKFEAFRNIVDAIGRALKTGFIIAVDAVKGAIESLGAVFKALFNGIATIWNNTVGKLSFKVPGWVPGLGGKGFDVPNIPMLANGGIVTSATLALIGERGPEAVVPLSKAGQYGMGGGGEININVNGADPQAVVDALRRYMRTNGAVPIRVATAI
jgi:hypothetical protein